MARPRIGSVVEIRTSKGLAYAQYTHQHKRNGALIRVFRELHEARPADLAAVVRGEELFRAIFVPLSAGVKRGIWTIVGEQPVPEDRKQFPVFRAGALPPGKKKVTDWWLWDGEKEWRVGTLDEEQKSYPMRITVNDTALAELIERGGYYDWCNP